MGNELSHRSYWCRRLGRFEKLPAEEKTAVPDVPDVPRAQPAQGEGFWGSLSHPESEKHQGASAGLQGGEREMASSSPPVALGIGRSSELQEPGDNPATQPGGKTPAPTQGGAEPAGGHTEVTTRDFPLQPAAEMEAKQKTVKSSSGLHKRPSTRVCRASPLCRWLKKLKTPAEKPKAKPGAVTSQE